MMSKTIRGAGGGQPSQPAPRAASVSPDSLVSKQFARILDLVSEGEVEGLVDGLKSVYLDDTPLENADGSKNFSGFTVEFRSGAVAQEYISGFPAVESAYSVGVEATQNVPVVRQVTNPNIDAVRINVAVPQLYHQDATTGDVKGSKITLKIEVQPSGEDWQTLKEDTISGKCSSRYNRNYRIDLPGSGPWNIRLTKTSPNTDGSTARSLFWESMTEIIDAKFSYPNSALVGITIDSSQFNSIPTRAYDLKGLRIKVPSNYNPVTRAYTGIWDGTFQVAWSDNPAWCFYDLLTNPRYGLGEFVSESQVDKANLYTIGRYCDELVPDGYGGMEPRFTCNLYLQTREDAFKVLSDMAGLFRGMLFWASGGLSCTQDRPEDPIYQFTNANVIDGAFTYNGSSRNVRHTTALISYNDPLDRYARKVEYVEDADGIQKYGVRQFEAVAIGCASRGQAHRMGKAVLLTERYLTETVTFKTGLEGTVPYPGAVIEVMDNSRAGVRFGGRVRSATAEAVTLDAPVTLDAGESYVLTIIKPDGTMEERGIVVVAGEQQTLQPVTAFSEAPNAHSVWVLQSTQLVPQQFKVVGIKELDDLIFEVTALAYNPGKFAAIEQNLVFEPLATSIMDNATLQWPPTNLRVSESLYQSSITTVDANMTVTWDAPSDTTWLSGYEVAWRINGGNWNVLPVQPEQTVTIEPVMPGPVDVRVVAVNRIGVRSRPAEKSVTLVGKTAAPLDVAGFHVTKVNGVAYPVWDLHADLDVRIGGRIVIRHTPDLFDPRWENSYVLEQFDGNATTGAVPLMTGTYMAKAIDSSGNWSPTAVMFAATEGMVTGFVTVSTVIEDSTFAGAMTNVVRTDGWIQIASATAIDDMLDPIDSWGGIDATGGILAAGEYAFANVLDLGSVATRRLVADLSASAFDVGDWIDNRTENIDDWQDFDGAVINGCDVTIFASTTDDDPAGAPSWGPWTPFFVADFTARAVRFKALLTSASVSHNIAVSRLRVKAQVPA